MAASNPQGEMQFWFNGFPYQGIKNGILDGGEMQFWDAGFPYQYSFPASVSALTITKMMMGMGG